MSPLGLGFFWDGSENRRKIAWIKWDGILAAKEMGGLNIGSLVRFNLALIKEEVLEKMMGNGITTRFWTDVWVGNQSLVSRFPRLYERDCDPMCLVSERWYVGGWRWLWSRPITGGVVLAGPILIYILEALFDL